MSVGGGYMSTLNRFETFFGKIDKTVVLYPGVVGIGYNRKGVIYNIYENAQKPIHDAGISNGDWKIVSIDSEEFTEKLLIEKIKGSQPYKIKLAYIGIPKYVTKLISYCVKYFKKRINFIKSYNPQKNSL